MNRILIKDLRMNLLNQQISLSYFDGKIYTRNNGYDGLTPGCQMKLCIKNSYLDNYLEKLFCQTIKMSF